MLSVSGIYQEMIEGRRWMRERRKVGQVGNLPTKDKEDV